MLAALAAAIIDRAQHSRAIALRCATPRRRHLLTSEPLLTLSAVLTLALAVAAIVLPRRLDRARKGAIEARVSPLWPSLPCAAFLVALFRVRAQSVSFVLLLAQVALSVWIVYRHRRWPWIAALFAAALLAWSAVALAVYALAGTVG